LPARVWLQPQSCAQPNTVWAINSRGKGLVAGQHYGTGGPNRGYRGYTRNQGGVGAASNYEHAFNNYQFADDAFWTHGAHTLKFGADIEAQQYNYIARVTPGGRWNFLQTCSSFLTNKAKHFEAGIPSTITPRELRQDPDRRVFQDDWRLRSHLTLNLGLRYEMVTVIKDGQGKITSLPNITDAAPQCGVQFDSSFAPGGQQLRGSQALSVVALALTITTLPVTPGWIRQQILPSRGKIVLQRIGTRLRGYPRCQIFMNVRPGLQHKEIGRAAAGAHRKYQSPRD